MKSRLDEFFKECCSGADTSPMSWSSRPRRLLTLLSLALVLSLPLGLVAGIPLAGASSVPAGEPGSGPQAPSTSTSTASSPASAAPSAFKFTDLTSKDQWAKTAIQRVAQDRLWMRDFGDTRFRPGLAETRGLFARTLVRAYGDANQKLDPKVTFDDMDESDEFYSFANIAVSNGWMRPIEGKFKPEEAVTIESVYRGLVMTLPLQEELEGLDDIHDASGYRFDHPPSFPTTQLGMRLYFRYNHGSASGTEAQDLEPNEPMPRAEVAWALYKRMNVTDSQLTALRIYRNIELPRLDPPMRKVVEFGLKYVGYPYIWGGEWYKANGAQPTGGFDCSGLMWWLTKSPVSGYDNTKIRGYNGWSLPQRTSATMAAQGSKVKYANIAPGDLLFFDGTGDGVIDHMNLNIGKGWSLDSSSGVGGITILRNGEGWYRDNFEHGRRFMNG